MESASVMVIYLPTFSVSEEPTVRHCGSWLAAGGRTTYVLGKVLNRSVRHSRQSVQDVPEFVKESDKSKYVVQDIRSIFSMRIIWSLLS